MILTLVMFAAFGIHSGAASAAEADDNSWLNDFTYSIQDGVVVVGRYVGPNTDVVISSPVTIDGVAYPVHLRDHLFSSMVDSPIGTQTRKITSITINGPVKLPEDCSYFFGNERANDVLTSISMPEIDASAVKDMSYMFNRQKALKTIDFGDMDTSNVENMEYMFAQCSELQSLDVSHFDTGKVTLMDWMFSYLYKVPVIDVSGFDTGNVTDMTEMFIGCRSVRKLDVSHFDTSKVTSMQAMFEECMRLTSLDLSSFHTSLVTDMVSMFTDCALLASVDLSNFDTAKVQSFGSMFYRCSMLNKIKLGEGFTNWNTLTLPAGNWTHGSLTKTESELAAEYPSHASEWAGAWYLDLPVQRIYGANRSSTSIQAASFRREVLGFFGDRPNAVILASGESFADALAGSYLANMLDCPILLLRNSAKSLQAVYESIAYNVDETGKIYVLGGTNAVPEDWLTPLRESFGDEAVERVSGSTRFSTNIEILKKAGFSGGEIFVTTADNFADSLSASATDKPILLVRGDSIRAKDQADYLKSFKGNLQFVILGGTNAVSEALEADLKKYGTVKERIAGNNRYQTSVLIAQKYFDNPQRAVLAYGEDFPDGLSGGPVAYQLRCPMLLLRDNNRKTLIRDYLKSRDIRVGYVMGGSKLLGDALVQEVFDTSLEVKVYGQ